VTKTQSAGPISCLEHRATRVLHCDIVTRAAVLMFPLLLQTILSNQMRLRRLRCAWFSRRLRHPARRRSGSILSPGTHTGLIEVSYSAVLHPSQVLKTFQATVRFTEDQTTTETTTTIKLCRRGVQTCALLLTLRLASSPP